MRVAVAIEKSISWRGHQEIFANVYHYDIGALATLIDSDASSLIDNIVALEKPVHSNDVTFKTGRVWETGGTPSQNQTLKIKDLSGAGTLVSGTTQIWAEAAVVVRLDTGRNSSTGKKIYLRKYIHAGQLNSANQAAAIGSGTLTSGNKGPYITYGNGIRQVGVGGLPNAATLEAPGGQNLASDAAVSVLDYLHIRQFNRN
jgi:hypothetical protein